MFRKIFNFDYNIQQIRISLENALFSAFSASIVVPSLLFYMTYDILDVTLLMKWISIQFSIFLGRVLVIQKLSSSVMLNNYNDVEAYFKIFIGLIFVTALLNLYIIILSMSYSLEALKIFLLSIVVITLSAGSASTLLGVFNVYLLFVVLNMFSFIDALLYFGGEDFYLFAFILTVFTLLILRTGYLQHTLIDKISSLKETFQTIYNTSADSIILIKDTRFKDCNQTTLATFNFDSKEELLKTHVSDFMPKYQADGTLSTKKMLKMLKLAHKKGYHSFEWQYKKRDGEIFWVDFILTRIYIDDEELLHGTFRDITKRKEREKSKEEFQTLLEKRVEEEVEKNRNKDKAMMYQSRLAQMGEMINMIAHQWRQPLSAITAATGTLSIRASRGKIDAQTVIKLSEKITEFSMHLSATIEDFRNFFKSNTSKVETDYQKITKSVFSIIESSLNTNHINLELEIVELYKLHTYENEIKQVLLNLIKNAEDVLVEKEIKTPTITVKIDKYDLIVSDNGGGVDEAILERIFEPYFSTKLQKNGTGLGLYMSKLIVEDHCKGKISVINSKDGASFKISLGGRDA